MARGYLTTTLEILATVCAGLFAGAALYINLVEHPARRDCGTVLAVRQFAPSYRRAAVMQASLAIVGLASAGLAWWRGAHAGILAGGLLLGAVLPFTLLVVRPTNKRLLAPRVGAESVEATALLRRWGRLHAVRTVLGLLAFGTLMASIALATPS